MIQIVLLAVAALAQAQKSEAGESRDHKELARLEDVWNQAHVTGDAEALDRLWSDDLVVMVPEMAPITKDKAIGLWKTGKFKYTTKRTTPGIGPV
jgi:hypothetical protein